MSKTVEKSNTELFCFIFVRTISLQESIFSMLNFLLFLRGAEPKQLAFSAALGITLGVFPICGISHLEILYIFLLFLFVLQMIMW
jgi:hypothetical protein